MDPIIDPASAPVGPNPNPKVKTNLCYCCGLTWQNPPIYYCPKDLSQLSDPTMAKYAILPSPTELAGLAATLVTSTSKPTWATDAIALAWTLWLAAQQKVAAQVHLPPVNPA